MYVFLVLTVECEWWCSWNQYVQCTYVLTSKRSSCTAKKQNRQCRAFIFQLPVVLLFEVSVPTVRVDISRSHKTNVAAPELSFTHHSRSQSSLAVKIAPRATYVLI